MALKTGDNPRKTHPTIDRKGGKNFDIDNPFLSSESDICSLLYLADFRLRNNKLSSVISKHFIFGTFSNDGIVQERSIEEDRLIAIILSRRYICLSIVMLSPQRHFRPS